jgi:ABC-type nitrate/sulfonate/bicarbonate transport system substrate-binding protein
VSFGVYDGTLASAIEVLAIENGFLEKEGVKAKAVKFTSGPTMMASFLGGDTPFASTSPGFWNAAAQGECFKVFGNDSQSYYSLIATQKAVAKVPALASGYPASVRAMKGLRIGVAARGGANEQNTNLVLQSVGLDPKDVTYIATGSTQTALAALDKDQIDVLLSFPPVEQLLKKRGTPYTLVANLHDGSIPTFKDLLLLMPAVNCGYAQKNPETAQKVCRGYAAAYRWATDKRNNKAMAAFISKLMNVTPDMAQEIWDGYRATFAAGPAVRKDLWNEQLKYYPAVKQIPDFEKYTLSCEKN